jgi:hypothetical protein
MPKKKKTSRQDLLARARAALSDATLKELANYTVDYATDPRFNELDRRDAYFRGTVYDGRPFDWDGLPRQQNAKPLIVGASAQQVYRNYNGDDEKAPVKMRRPNTQYALGRIVPNRFAAMLFGNRVFPHIQVPKSKDTEHYLNGLVKKAQLKLHMYNAALLGGSMGSVVTMFKVVNGRFRIENFNAKWVTPLWDDFGENEMSAFSICFPIAKLEFNKDKNIWEHKPYLYRRIVTEQFDVEFQLQPGKVVFHGDGVSVKPKDDSPLVINEDRVYEHGYGFVPAQFIQHLFRPDQIDGDPACEGAYDLIDRINEGLAAVHGAVQANLDPTLVLKLSADDYAKLMSMGGVVRTGTDGTGVVVGEKGDAKYIEITCEGIKAAMEIIGELRTYMLEVVDCVIADPHKLTGAAQSAAAIQLLYSPMLAKTDVLRVQYGEQAFRKLLGKMLNAYFMLTEAREDEETGDILNPKLKMIEVQDPETNKMRQVEPDPSVEYDDIELLWGDYFPPTTADMFQATEAAVMATGGRAVMTVARASRALASYYGDSTNDQTVADLKKQEEEDEQHEMTMATLGAKAKAAQSGPKPGSSSSVAKTTPPTGD